MPGGIPVFGRSVHGWQVMVAGILPRELRMFRALNRELDVYMPLAREMRQP
jgi:hypothetical protein